MWKTCISNRICYTQEKFREQNLHLERLFSIKPMTNTSKPYKPYFLEIKTPQIEARLQTQTKINYENHLLDKKLFKIFTNEGKYNQNVLRPNEYPAFKRIYNYKYDDIVKQIKLIEKNRVYKYRIENLKSNYSREEMSKEAELQEKYKNNILKRPKSIPFTPAMNFVSIRQVKQRLEKQLLDAQYYYEQQQNKTSNSHRASSAKKENKSNNSVQSNNKNKSLNKSNRSQSSKNRKSLKIDDDENIQNESKKNLKENIVTCEKSKKETGTTKGTTGKKI